MTPEAKAWVRLSCEVERGGGAALKLICDPDRPKGRLPGRGLEGSEGGRPTATSASTQNQNVVPAAVAAGVGGKGERNGGPGGGLPIVQKVFRGVDALSRAGVFFKTVGVPPTRHYYF